VGPKFRLKANSAGLTTEDTGGTERVLANDRVHGMESPLKSDGSASHPYWGFAGRCRAAGRAESGCSGGDAAGVAGAALRVADGRVVSELSWEEGWSLLARKARMVRRAEPFFLCVFCGSNELYINKLFPNGLCKTRTVQRVLLQIQSDESKK